MTEKETPPNGLSGEEIGQVIGFFAIPSAALIELKEGSLKIGDKIWIKGQTTDLVETISSMQVEHTAVSDATRGHRWASRFPQRFGGTTESTRFPEGLPGSCGFVLGSLRTAHRLRA